MAKPLFAHRDDLGKLVLRVMLGVILLFHGVYKLQHGVDWIKPRLAHLYLPGFLAYGTVLAEAVAPVLLIVGYYVRLAGLVVAFDMVMAVVLVLHSRFFTLATEPGGGWAIEFQALIFTSGLALALLGGGRFGLDRGRA